MKDTKSVLHPNFKESYRLNAPPISQHLTYLTYNTVPGFNVIELKIMKLVIQAYDN